MIYVRQPLFYCLIKISISQQIVPQRLIDESTLLPKTNEDGAEEP